ncbi:MAG: xanthine dehydrogenase family protein molybdopterin-binding subunit [Proteobacteria bacterium]|nr:xanthine dehydrogenase family protein molybdopterin-binding subunit [Pseudomonadota bacterium]
MKFGMGQAVRRKEDDRLLTGKGRYLDDINLPDQCYAYVLRSPHAHATIKSIDIGAAKKAPGVIAVLTGADADKDQIAPIPCLAQVTPDMVIPTRKMFTTDRVRFVGDMVAAVLGETIAAARDASELIEIEYEELPAECELAKAADGKAPQIWPNAPGNVSFVWQDGDKAKTDACFKRAARRVTIEVINNRVVPNSMETRGALAAYDAKADSYTLHVSSQGSHLIKDVLCGSIFPKHDPEKIRVVTPDVGGGFGMKVFLYPEYVLALWGSKRVSRPVKWIEDRTEAFLSDVHGRDNVTRAELALDERGKFLAIRIRTLANMGAYLSMFGPYIPTVAGQGMHVGVYDFEAAHIEVKGIFTNTVPVDAYRGAGRPEAAYMLERLVAAAARETGMTPDAIRLRNFIAPEKMPFKTILGLTYDSGNFPALLKRALSEADTAGAERRKQDSAKTGKLRGVGLAYYIETCGGAPNVPAIIRFEEDESVSLIVGTHSNGQGHETAYSQLAAERLGIPFESIKVKQGDTALMAKGSFTGGSRSVPVGGAATRIACDDAIEKGKEAAAHLLETAALDIAYDEGRYVVAGTDRAVGVMDVARAIREGRTGAATGTLLSGEADFLPQAPTFPNGCHICELEVDRDTGEVAIQRYTVVDDFGRIVNPLLLTGQVHGGIAQGIGQALLEEARFDDTGQMLTASFMDYAMPRADNLPSYAFSWEVIPCQTNPLGIKGCGEAGAIGAPPAVMNALIDALAPLGITDLQMPATSHRIWQAMQRAKRPQAAE